MVRPLRKKMILTNLISNLKTYIIVAAVSSLTAGGITYRFTADHFEAKIAIANDKAREDILSVQKQGDEIVAGYVLKLKDLNAKVVSYEKQKQSAIGSSKCDLSNGFVRLYNASASGSTTSSGVADGASSGVDAATLFDVLIANNIKYNEVVKQLEALQAFEKAHP